MHSTKESGIGSTHESFSGGKGGRLRNGRDQLDAADEGAQHRAGKSSLHTTSSAQGRNRLPVPELVLL